MSISRVCATLDFAAADVSLWVHSCRTKQINQSFELYTKSNPFSPLASLKYYLKQLNLAPQKCTSCHITDPDL